MLHVRADSAALTRAELVRIALARFSHVFGAIIAVPIRIARCDRRAQMATLALRLQPVWRTLACVERIARQQLIACRARPQFIAVHDNRTLGFHGDSLLNEIANTHGFVAHGTRLPLIESHSLRKFCSAKLPDP